VSPVQAEETQEMTPEVTNNSMEAMTKLQQIQTVLGVAADDIPGPITQGAIDAEIATAKARHAHAIPAPVVAGDAVDPRSEANIKTLLPQVQPLARALVSRLQRDGMDFRITSGTRTFEEQEALYEKHLQGGPLAARPGYSNHNYGLAFDLSLFKNGSPVWESPLYETAGKLGESLGLFWGGSWSGKDEDQPHFELRPAWAKDMSEGTMIAELRMRQANGRDLLA
jgi:peptidoglycan L-alanyl-D-glutamate endopeptidase CwlK